MPFYRCLIPKGSLSFEQRQEIALAFTDVHCGISAAPRHFVNVVFLEVSDGAEITDSHGRGMLKRDTPYFIAGGNRADTPYFIAGGNRAGPPEMKQQILDGLIDKFSVIAGIPRDQVHGHISEAPASWTMEAGKILPDPGSETAEWYEHAAALG